MLAQFPPMGWNSWDCYGAAVTEETVRKNADYMAANLKQYGWEYIVVDIQWYQPSASSHDYVPFAPLEMDEYGRLIPAVNRFPSAADGKGFAPLAEYVHSLGLKFGIHIMRGLPRMAAQHQLPIKDSRFTCADAANPNSICMWNPDMYGLRCDGWTKNPEAAQDYYNSIFRLYAEWGVDFVKCDDIAREYPHCEKEIEMISQSSRTCGRDIVLSLSPGPAPVERAEHLKKYANMWRITDDFWDRWDLLKKMFERAEKWCIHAGPGHWPDADMLPVGALRQCEDENEVTHFTQEEQRTMMTLWSMMRSPLMIGSELNKMDDFTVSLLTNAELLAIGKESFCGHPLYTTDTASAWIAPRKDGTGVYAALFNLSDKKQTLELPAEAVELEKLTGKELWTGKQMKNRTSIRVTLKPHDAAVWLLEK